MDIGTLICWHSGVFEHQSIGGRQVAKPKTGGAVAAAATATPVAVAVTSAPPAPPAPKPQAWRLLREPALSPGASLYY